MKKLIVITLSAVLLFPVFALATTLSVDISTATLDELQQAVLTIANRISELRAVAAPSSERLELSGIGTTILSNVTIPFSPSRIIIETDGDFSATLTGGPYDHNFSTDLYNAVFFDEQGTYTLLVEAKGAWTFTVVPIMPGASLPLSGTGSYVSDYFELPVPMIVAVKCAPGSMTEYLTHFNVILHCQYENSNSWRNDYLSAEMVTPSSGLFQEDVIINPISGRMQYCISVSCNPGVEWSINPK